MKDIFTSDHSYIIFKGKVVCTTLKTWDPCTCRNDCDCLHNHCQVSHEEARQLAAKLNQIFKKIGGYDE